MSELRARHCRCRHTRCRRAYVGRAVLLVRTIYRVQDFTLDIDANPALVRGQALLIGYLYQPYTAHTVWGRLVYHW